MESRAERATMNHLFLSYSRADSEFADRVRAALEQHGFDVWLDRSDIPVGIAWEASISAALQNCDAIVAVLSPSFFASENVARELSLGGEYGRKIMPIEARPTAAGEELSASAHRIKYWLAGLQRVSFAGQDFDAAVERLVAALSHTALPELPPPQPPRRWVWYAAGAGVLVLAIAFAVQQQFSSRDEEGTPVAPQHEATAAPAVTAGAVPNVEKEPRLPGPTQSSPSTKPVQPGMKLDVDGTWYGTVVYPWGDTYDESFEFRSDGSALEGSMTYLNAPEEIADGRIQGDRLHFALHRRVEVNDVPRDVVYKYDGKVEGAEIRFVAWDDFYKGRREFILARSRDAARAAVARRTTGGADPTLQPFSGSGYPVELMRSRLEERMGPIRDCFRAAMHDPIDHQIACYAFTLDAQGQVVDFDTSEGRRSAALDACMEGVFRTIRWGPQSLGHDARQRLCFSAPIPSL